jgi:hypothetical protein
MCGEEPYRKLDKDEVKRRFENFNFPTPNHLGCGTLIQNYRGRLFATAEQVIQALVHARKMKRV